MTDLPDNLTIAGTTFPVSGINLLEDSAQSWSEAGYVNVHILATWPKQPPLPAAVNG